MNIKLMVAVAGALAALSGAARADYNPVGVQNDVAYTDVINGGWSVVYRADYGSFSSISSMFGSIAAGSMVMLAGIRDGSSTIDVLAAATIEDVLLHTAHNATHAANGALWYSNGYSLGFAGLGDTISQSSADTSGWYERDRLSWHTGVSGTDWGNFQQDPNAPASVILGGWRSGDNTGLNDSTDWDKMVLVQAAPVPEPETYALMLAGLGLLGMAQRRRKQQAATA
jgi:hypothetical protein